MVNIDNIPVGNNFNNKNLPLHRRLRWYHYLTATLTFILIYQAIMLYLWFTHDPNGVVDRALLRFSLSNSDAMSISAWGLAIFSMYLLEKKVADAEQSMNNRIDTIAKEWGLDPIKVKKTVEIISNIDPKTIEAIGIVSKELGKVDPEHIKLLVRDYVNKVNKMQSLEQMQKDFDGFESEPIEAKKV